MIIWQQIQKNYFYGQHSELTLTTDGYLRESRRALDDSSPEPEGTLLHKLEAEALNELLPLLREFFALEAFIPSGLIPDDFPWVCTLRLDGREHQLSIYSNSPPEQRELLQRIEARLRAPQRP